QANRPTAIIGANNTVALSALQAIQALGFRCPEDISLAMIDTVQWGEVITPKITTVAQDTDQLGTIIAHRPLETTTDPKAAAKPAQDYILTPKFIPGTSCAKIG